MFCTNCRKTDIITGFCSWVEIHPYQVQEKTKEFSMLHRHLIFSFVHWYNRQALTGFLPSSAAASIHYRYTLCTMNAAVHICIALHTMYDDISSTVSMLRQFDQ